MAVYSLAICSEENLEVELFTSRPAAEDAFMRDLYEHYQGYDLPAAYDPADISEWIGENGITLSWSIEKHNGYTDSAAPISA